MEQARESITLTILRACCHGAIDAIALFIAGLGALPSHHGAALWRDKCGGAIGQTEGCALFLDDGTLGIIVLLTRDEVAEGHVVVAHRELGRHLLTLSILEVNGELLSHVVHLRLLHLAHLVGAVGMGRLGVGDGELLGEVAKVSLEAQGRWQQHLTTIEGDGIGSLLTFVVNRNNKFSVG